MDNAHSVPRLRDQGLIGGRWSDADDGARFEVLDPANGKLIATVPAMGPKEAQRAIDAAAAALPGWQRVAARERGRVLRRWAELVVQHQGELAQLLTTEQGKPKSEAAAEILSVASFLEWFADEGRRIYGETIPGPDPSMRLVVLKQPVGVCVGITPWNFPASMVARKVAPALAAGCSFVLKPAEQTPLIALAITELALDAGLPDGVLNVLTVAGPDAPSVGRELTSNPQVRKVTFTGSTEVGKLLMAQCAQTVKSISLELGGNAPFIVFEDADLDAAVAGAMMAKFRNAGQVCIAANRLLVADAIYDDFSQRLIAAAQHLRIGAGSRESTQVGPLIEAAAVEKAERHVEDARERGGVVRLGGRRHPAGAHFFEPTVITDVDAEALLANEETFGPIAGLLRFGTEAEAVALANGTPSGLASYIYTRDLARSWRVSEALEAGLVGVNTPVIAMEVAPFGGVKQSGIGREGSHYGIEEYLEVKLMSIGGITGTA